MDHATDIIARKLAVWKTGALPDPSASPFSSDVEASWARLVHSGIDPQSRIRFEVDEGYSVRQAQERSALLLQAVQTAVEQHGRALPDAAHNVYIVSDAQDYCVQSFGITSAHSTLLQQSCVPGVVYSEQLIGTAAMNVARASGRMARTYGPEHYAFMNHALFCLAVPLRNPQGGIEAVLNLSRDHDCDDPFLPGRLRHMAAQTEDLLLQHYARRHDLRLLEFKAPAGSAEGLPHSGRLLVAVDAQGQARGCNSAARAVMGDPLTRLDRAWWQGLLEGRDLNDLPLAQDHFVTLGAASAAPIQVRQVHALAAPRGTERIPAGPRVAALRPPQASAVAHAAPPEAATLPHAADQALAQQAVRALAAGLSVLVLGESGSGKEHLARAIHAQSARRAGPFIAVNCAAFPESMIESELFGYVEGAFTGGRRGGAPGRLEEAQDGTLFLDEIGDMDLALQTRLLRVLERREVARLGSGAVRALDVQVICATHQAIELQGPTQRLRQDLYFRIAGYVLRLPPLRAQPDVEQRLQNLARPLLRSRTLTPAAWQALRRHAWPGNYREARTFFARVASQTNEGAHLDLDDVMPFLDAAPTPRPPATAPVHTPAAIGEPATAATLAAAEQQAIREALAECQGNISHSAQRLRISRSTLQRKLRKMGWSAAPAPRLAPAAPRAATPS